MRSLKLTTNRPYAPDFPSLGGADGDALERLAPAADYMRPLRTRPKSRPLFDPPKPAVQLLVVEGEPYTRRLLRVLLAHPRLVVYEATDGEAAIDLLAMRAFDLVLLGMDLPGMSGADTLSWIRRSPTPWSDIPILGLIPEHEKPHRLMLQGLTETTPKPLSRADLTQKLLALLPGLHDAGL